MIEQLINNRKILNFKIILKLSLLSLRTVYSLTLY